MNPLALLLIGVGAYMLLSKNSSGSSAPNTKPGSVCPEGYYYSEGVKMCCPETEGHCIDVR